MNPYATISRRPEIILKAPTDQMRLSQLCAGTHFMRSDCRHTLYVFVSHSMNSDTCVCVNLTDGTVHNLNDNTLVEVKSVTITVK